MAEDSWLSGRVTRRRLPWIKPGGADQPALKRLDLPQGELAQVHDAAEGMRYLAAIELTAGTVRGNHLHRRKVEHLYVVRGELELHVGDPESGEDAVVSLSAGDLTVVEPGVAHALRILRDGFAIEFSPQRFDPADVVGHELV